MELVVSLEGSMRKELGPSDAFPPGFGCCGVEQAPPAVHSDRSPEPKTWREHNYIVSGFFFFERIMQIS